MARFLLVLALAISALAQTQTPCENTPAYSPCEMTFELFGSVAAAHPDPYADVDLHIEFRSPHFKTYLMPAYWAGGNRMAIRFTPTEAGPWNYRITSNIASLDGKEGTFNAASSDSPGFVHPKNVHHWWTENKQPHLWIGDVADRLAFMSPGEFDQKLADTVQNKFTHLRLSILGAAGDRSRIFNGKRPNTAYFDELDRRIIEINKKGIVADLVLASDPAIISSLAPDRDSRKQLIRYLVGRYAPMNITWQGVMDWEDFPDGRALLKEIGLALRNTDPYDHPRSTNAKITSSPLLGDGWMNFIIERSTQPGDDQMGSIEHQLYPVPFVGITTAQRIWNTTMDGEYPVFEGKGEAEARHWHELIEDSRHWELEPYFDVDGGRAVALEGVEYLLYVDGPGPVEVDVEKHGYDVRWFDPRTGETMDAKKYKGEAFTADVPDKSHPWVLEVSREGRKESMLKSYYFESTPIIMQEVEQTLEKVPFTVTAPSGGNLPVSAPVPYSIKLTRQTRATRTMFYLWTGEVATEGQGARVLGTGPEGTFRVPDMLAKNYPAVLSLRVTAINANGKAYSVDHVFQLTK